MLNIKRRLIIALIIFIFFVVSSVTFWFGTHLIYEEFYSLAGHDAQNIATVMSTRIKLTDKDVTELKKLSYKQLMTHPLNLGLKKQVETLKLHSPIEYIYIVTPLNNNEIRYRVTQKTSSFFSAPIGTPLDVVWLLDVPVTVNSPDIEEDAYRYFNATEDLSHIISQRKPAFGSTLDDGEEWGEAVRGYAPVYSSEGNFVGMLGVDLSESEFLGHAKQGFIIVWIVLIISNLSLFSIMLFYFFAYLRLRDKQMYRDPLTNAYNRRFMDLFLLKKLRSKVRVNNEPVIFMMLDLDHFKHINDTYGHPRGDQCLKEICKTVFNIFKDHNELLIRFGGEEFLIGTTIHDEKAAKELMQTVLDSVRALRLFRENNQSITISIGAVICKIDKVNSKNIREIIDIADQNLYQAKKNGRDQYCMSIIKNQ